VNSDLIERAKKALQGATPGPWGVIDGMQSRPVEVAGCLLAHFSKDVAGPRHRNDNARLIALAPDLARLAVAAGELADVLIDLLDNRGDCYIPIRIGNRSDWDDDAHAALARFRAIAEGRE
jgi:hypothetical protein